MISPFYIPNSDFDTVTNCHALKLSATYERQSSLKVSFQIKYQLLMSDPYNTPCGKGSTAAMLWGQDSIVISTFPKP